MECRHEFGDLVVLCGAQGRGAAPSYRVECKCGESWDEVAGLTHILGRLQEEIEVLWRAVSGLEGTRPVVSKLVRAKKEPEECKHFLAWLAIRSKSGTGRSGSWSLFCSGCKRGWDSAAGFKLFMDLVKQEQDSIRAQLRELQGRGPAS